MLCQSLFSCICSFWVLQWFVVSRETYGVGVGTRAPPPHYNDMRYLFISSNDNATWLGAWCPCFRRSWIDVLLKSFVVRCLCEKSKMKAFTGWRQCHAIWWGLKFTELTFANLVSNVKKVWFLLYPSRSGRPATAKFSTLSHVIWGVDDFNFLIKSFSFFT